MCWEAIKTRREGNNSRLAGFQLHVVGSSDFLIETRQLICRHRTDFIYNQLYSEQNTFIWCHVLDLFNWCDHLCELFMTCLGVNHTYLINFFFGKIGPVPSKDHHTRKIPLKDDRPVKYHWKVQTRTENTIPSCFSSNSVNSDKNTPKPLPGKWKHKNQLQNLKWHHLNAIHGNKWTKYEGIPNMN